MTDERRLDLSALDPELDPARWDAIVRSTNERVDRVFASRTVDPLTLIAGWMKSVTAGVAVLLIMLVPLEFLLERRELGREQVDRLVQLSAESIRGGGSLSGAELARALGGKASP